MSTNTESRVLCRQLARDLTPEELDTTKGGGFQSPSVNFSTRFCTLMPTRDGDDD